jgi:hypothetical protein
MLSANCGRRSRQLPQNDRFLEPSSFNGQG